MRLLVLGASGGCGRWLVRLAVERGHEVTVVVREGARFDRVAGVEVRRGEILSGVLEEVVPGHEAVASCVGIRRKHVLNPWSRVVSPRDLTTSLARELVRVMSESGRLVAISAAGVGDSEGTLGFGVRRLIRWSNIGVAYADLTGMEEVLAGSGLDWAVVRPVTLVNRKKSRGCRVVERYRLMDRIARVDVAGWMLDVLERDRVGVRAQMIGW